MKQLLKALLGKLGYEIRRRPAQAAPPVAVPGPGPARDTVGEALRHIRSQAWQPGSVIDVGAANGDFTAACHQIFPDANYLLVEPLSEYELALRGVLEKVPLARLAPVAAGLSDGAVELFVHGDWFGSSMYRETEGPQVDGVSRIVPLSTIDRLCQEHRLAGPYLFKIDVQGAELDVLAGAVQTLSQSEYVVLEVSLFQFFIGGPQFHDLIARMQDYGFALYDVMDPIYRLYDGALGQMDLAFVKCDGRFRRAHIYATPEQRAAQNERFENLRQAKRPPG